MGADGGLGVRVKMVMVTLILRGDERSEYANQCGCRQNK